jgi:hypothetical protein
MSFAPGLTSDLGLGRNALKVGSDLKSDVDSRRWHSLQESAKKFPSNQNALGLGSLQAAGSKRSPNLAISDPTASYETHDDRRT